jgi:hypothetical protein
MSRFPFSGESLAIRTRLSPEQITEKLLPLVEPERRSVSGAVRMLLSSKPLIGEVRGRHIVIRKLRDRRVAFQPTLVAQMVPNEDGTVLDCKIGLAGAERFGAVFIFCIWLVLTGVAVRSLAWLPAVDEVWRKGGVLVLFAMILALVLVVGRWYFCRERTWLIDGLITELSGTRFVRA